MLFYGNLWRFYHSEWFDNFVVLLRAAFLALILTKMHTLKMLSSIKRIFTIAFGGALGMLIWAVVFGTCWGLVMKTLSDNPNDNGYSDIDTGIGLMSFFCVPLGFIVYGIAGIFTSNLSARATCKYLLRFSVTRSSQAAVIFGIIGSVVTITVANNTNWLSRAVIPSYVIGLGAGSFLGFIIGIIAGVVEGAAKARRA